MKCQINNKNVIHLSWDNKEQIKAVSHLQMKLLPESILSQLGYLFLSKFYYSKLPKHKLIDVYLYKEKEDYVGFISCTNKPFTFMKEGLKNNFFLIISILIISIILKPSRLLILFKFIFETRKDKLMINYQNKYGNKMGEFLSFGVLKDYRRIIDDTEKVSIPNVLMVLVSTHFRANNIKYALLRILDTNLVAIKFYKKHSGVVFPSEKPNQVVIIIET